jgi:hypothetical protein
VKREGEKEWGTCPKEWKGTPEIGEECPEWRKFMPTVLANSVKCKIEKKARGDIVYKQLYSKQQHNRLQKGKRDKVTCHPCLFKPQKPVTQQPGLINTYTVT